MADCKICHAVIAISIAADLICASCQGSQEPGIVPDQSFEMSKPEHTEREAQEWMLSPPRDQAAFTPPTVPFIPRSYDPSEMIISDGKKYIDDHYACVLISYRRSQVAPLALVSSQSAPS
jgi:hypothetical protein